MKTIHINNQEGVRCILFPDQQPHVQVLDIQEEDEVTVICSLTSPTLLLQLLQTANALDHRFAQKKKLIIPYLMGARYDRLMQTGDSVDLQVVAQLINSCGFEKVFLYDVHSPTAGMLIHRSVLVTNQHLVTQYQHPNAVLICPDAGAAKKTADYQQWNPCLTDVVHCVKHRNLATGEVSLEVLSPNRCNNRHCIIIDDLCDGGATFIAIAQQIQPAHLTLMVTHGIFSKGFDQLEKYFQQILVSDSYHSSYASAIVQVLPMKW